MPQAKIKEKLAQQSLLSLCEACAVEMHMDIAQEPAYARIYRKKKTETRWSTPDQAPAPAFKPTVRTPQCGHTVWGKTRKIKVIMPIPASFQRKAMKCILKRERMGRGPNTAPVLNAFQ